VEPLILDASVLIGLLDAADAHHERAVEDTEAVDREGRQLLLPASAYSEALVAFARAKRVGDAREAVAGMGVTIVPLTAAMAEAAAELRARYESLRLPDAMVLACVQLRRGRLLTYDQHLNRLSRRIARATKAGGAGGED
jgi:predicted nucleic acid-binding protein